MKAQPQRVIGYCRRSQQREERYGLDAQADAVRKWADYTGAEVIEMVQDDATSAGQLDTTEREGLARALAMVKGGTADAIVVARFDRLARSLIGFADLLRLSQQEGWAIVCLDPQMNFSTAVGRAMGAMLVSFGDVEREAFALRMAAGRRAKIAAGGYGGGVARHRRYGAQLVEVDGRREYQPVPEEVETIERIRRERAEGAKLREIAEGLERDGIEAPGGGATWYLGTVRSYSRQVA
jgi:DNA invertase Pin-like site-specific DNA recombinase